jgi:hypothetical protein
MDDDIDDDNLSPEDAAEIEADCLETIETWTQIFSGQIPPQANEPGFLNSIMRLRRPATVRLSARLQRQQHRRTTKPEAQPMAEAYQRT